MSRTAISNEARAALLLFFLLFDNLFIWNLKRLGGRMTVGELINRLQRLDKDEPVTIEELLKIINGIYVDTQSKGQGVLGKESRISNDPQS